MDLMGCCMSLDVLRFLTGSFLLAIEIDLYSVLTILMFIFLVGSNRL